MSVEARVELVDETREEFRRQARLHQRHIETDAQTTRLLQEALKSRGGRHEVRGRGLAMGGGGHRVRVVQQRPKARALRLEEPCRLATAHRFRRGEDAHAALCECLCGRQKQRGVSTRLDEVAAAASGQCRRALERSLEVDARREPLAPVGGVQWLLRGSFWPNGGHKNGRRAWRRAYRQRRKRAAVPDARHVKVHRVVPRMRRHEPLGFGMRRQPRLRGLRRAAQRRAQQRRRGRVRLKGAVHGGNAQLLIWPRVDHVRRQAGVHHRASLLASHEPEGARRGDGLLD